MDQNPKQQLVERIKAATNILVTVSTNPSVDQLAACIGFTLLLNKFDKHATAVFSGKVPSTLEFLQPEKTIEQTTDSLQDFIIALDKSKADKLRYKVEDDVVRIFITPYRTSITEKDLDFSMGDLNVDVVVALGVMAKDDLDQAIVAHGRILHDAVVISVTNGDAASNIGGINWNEPSASSLCEMLVSVSESFKSGLLDGQMATSFLTGIVAETERFSNSKTSPKVMTMSAQLMAAGANQQLIATELAPKPVEPPPAPQPPEEPQAPVFEPAEPQKTEEPEESEAEVTPAPSGELPLSMPELEETPQSPPPEEQPPVAPPEPEELEPPKNDGEMTILHNDGPSAAEDDSEAAPAEIAIDDQGNLKHHDELKVEAQMAQVATPAQASTSDMSEASTPADAPTTEAEPADDTEAPAEVAAPEPDSPLNIPIIKKPSSSYVQAPPTENVDNSIQLPPLDPNLVANDVVRGAAGNDEPAEAPEAPRSSVQSPMPLEPPQPSQPPLAAPPMAADPAVDLDEARKAVNTAALDSAYRPEPVASLGALFIDTPPATPEPPATPDPVVAPEPAAIPEPTVAPAPTETVSDAFPPITTLPGNGSILPPAAEPATGPGPAASTLPPPPVPPPMTMPFKPKTNHHNPYLQPPGTEDDSEQGSNAAL